MPAILTTPAALLREGLAMTLLATPAVCSDNDPTPIGPGNSAASGSTDIDCERCS
jgi:hypothetical protein